MFLEWENNGGKLQIISGKFQNNAIINDVKQIYLAYFEKKNSNTVVHLLPIMTFAIFMRVSGIFTFVC